MQRLLFLRHFRNIVSKEVHSGVIDVRVTSIAKSIGIGDVTIRNLANPWMGCEYANKSFYLVGKKVIYLRDNVHPDAKSRDVDASYAMDVHNASNSYSIARNLMKFKNNDTFQLFKADVACFFTAGAFSGICKLNDLAFVILLIFAYIPGEIMKRLFSRRNVASALKFASSEDLADSIYELKIKEGFALNGTVLERVCERISIFDISTTEEIGMLEDELYKRDEVCPIEAHGDVQLTDGEAIEVRNLIKVHPLHHLLINVDFFRLFTRKSDGGLSYVFHRRGRKNTIAFPIPQDIATKIPQLSEKFGYDRLSLLRAALTQTPVLNINYEKEEDIDYSKDLITLQEVEAFTYHGCKIVLAGNSFK